MLKVRVSVFLVLLAVVLTMTAAASGLGLVQDNDTVGAVDQRPVPIVKDVDVPAPASVLFIGNSFFYFNNSMHGHLSKMVAAGVPQRGFRATSVTISGSGLDWHDVDSYFRSNAIGVYSFDSRTTSFSTIRTRSCSIWRS